MRTLLILFYSGYTFSQMAPDSAQVLDIRNRKLFTVKNQVEMHKKLDSITEKTNHTILKIKSFYSDGAIMICTIKRKKRYEKI